MQFALALGTLVALASAYLLYQFWSGDLRTDDDASSVSAADHESPNETLKAA